MVILPSIDRSGHPLSARTKQRVRRDVQEWFAEAFPGSTSDRMQSRSRLRGRWGSGDGVTTEDVEEIWAYCTAVEFRSQRSRLVGLAERVWKLADQEAIAILVDGGMELVMGEER